MQIRPIAKHDDFLHVLAHWSISQWGHDFPGDSIDSYLDLYEKSFQESDELPIVFVALENNYPVGTATLVADDELPNAGEPGPWLAATFVSPEARTHGVGSGLVHAVESEARRLGYSELFLYTHDKQAWYEHRGWACVRTAPLHINPVLVMRKDLRD